MADVYILYGSVYGSARDAAEQLAQHLQSRGIDAQLLTTVDTSTLESSEAPIVIVTSTTGAGDIPDNLMPFYAWLQSSPNIYQRPYALAVLGDSSYFDTFCGAGEKLKAALDDLGARELVPMLQVDALEHADPVPPVLAWADALTAQLGLSA